MSETDTEPRRIVDTEPRRIVDAHHHVWRPQDLPWLAGEIVPRIFGPYEPIQRDYLAEEYAADATASGIDASVYVQTNWPLERAVDEVAWVQGEHERTGWPMAIVGSADLFDDRAPEVFEAQQRISPLMRGTRLQLHWHTTPEYRFASAPDRMKDPVLRRNIGRLAELDWIFELQVFAPQMADAAGLVAEHPDVTFVLVHAGMLEATDPDTIEAWQAGMAQLAAHPNVVVKLTGQGTFVRRLDEELIHLVARECVDLFGPTRCMFGTNFPVEQLWTDMPTLVDTWSRVIADVAFDDRHDIMAATAERVYRL